MYGQTFGIELETTGLEKLNVYSVVDQHGWSGTNNGHRVLIRHNDSSIEYEWRIMDDNSISPAGAEFVSPILRDYAASWEQIELFVELLKALEVKCNKTTGLHVHVGTYKTGEVDVSVLAHNWKIMLPQLLRAYRPYSYRNGKYCQMDFTGSIMRDNRYLGINATNTKGHNTIEFRLFNGAINLRHLCRAIRFSCGLTKLSAMGIRLALPIPIGKCFDEFVVKAIS